MKGARRKRMAARMNAEITAGFEIQRILTR